MAEWLVYFQNLGAASKKLNIKKLEYKIVFKNNIIDNDNVFFIISGGLTNICRNFNGR